jgi:hypothetical protein
MAEQHGIPNLDGLVALANRDGVDIKPTLLRVMTDLYVQKPRHSTEEERHYVELALRLIDVVDAPTRATVATKLAAYVTPPAAVMQRLRHKQAPAAAAPATPAPRSSSAAISELCQLFLDANSEERRLILVNLDCAPLPPAQPIALAVAVPAIARLEAAALSHNTAAFCRELESTFGLSHELARRLTDDESGEPVVVVARALAMPADVLQRILLCLNPSISQSVLRVYELARLYEDVAPQAAQRMIAIWRASHKPAQQRPASPQPAQPRTTTPRPTAHQPQLWHVEERPSLPARPQIRWEQHVQAGKAESQ